MSLDGRMEYRHSTERLRKTFETLENAEQGMQGSKTSLTTANRAADKIQNLTEIVEGGLDIVKPAKSEAMKPVRDWLDNLSGLLNLLDVAAELHPFIKVAVNAFRVVVSLEQKRRNNNNKIIMLFAEMRDMMEALVDLHKFKDKDKIGPNGQNIEARMQKRVRETAEDIKTCANVCDAYRKQRLIAKVIYSSYWDGVLQGYIETFVSHRKDFTLALLIYIGTSEDETKQKLEEIDQKLGKILDTFSSVMSPEQQQLNILVMKKGGANVVKNDDKVLKELLNFRPTIVGSQEKYGRGLDDAEFYRSDRNGDESDLEMVKQELLEHPTLAIEKNLKEFKRKFEMQEAKLEEMKQILNDTFQAVKSGAHDGVIESDIKTIWEAMRWPGQVKARHFVLALQEHYRQQMQVKRDASPEGNIEPEEDEWALDWINLSRMQAIAEAFDDDGSGFVTVAEVNQFTASRTHPKDLEWSLPHWLAYWAIGWHMTATKYRDMIDDICAKMFAIRSHIHSANREAIDSYLRAVWKDIHTLTSSFVGSYQTASLQRRFRGYVEAEEDRLHQALEEFRYDIDAMDTLLLITGPGRIEKYLFPVLWLVLQRDFKIFRLCQIRAIDGIELRKSCRSISWILQAVQQRHDSLEALFKQQKLDPGAQFKMFANELFDFWHEPMQLWSLDNLRKRNFYEIEYDNSTEPDQDLDQSKLLDYTGEVWFPHSVEDSINDTVANEAVYQIAGAWIGMDFQENRAISRTFCFHASAGHNTRKFWARSTNFNILGDCIASKGEDNVKYTFAQAFNETYIARRMKTLYWVGTLTDDGETLSGKWGYDKDDQPYTFIYKRIPHKAHFHDLPRPYKFIANRGKALWTYALTVVLDQTRRKLFSWSYLKERRDAREKFLGSLKKAMDSRGPRNTDSGWPVTDMDSERLLAAYHLRSELDFGYLRCSSVLQDFRQRTFPKRTHTICNYCRSRIYGTRLMCMECGSRDTFDFCDKPECMGCTIKTDDDITSPHLPTHDLVKVRNSTPVRLREIGKVLRNANAGLDRVERLFQEQGEGKDRECELASSAEKAGVPWKAEETTIIFTATCLRCDGVLSKPFWHCIDCPNDAKVFICWDCDEREAGFSHGEHHRATHNLVRCIEGKKEDKVEERFNGVEHKLEGLTSQVEGLSSQLTMIRSQMDGIEKLLRSSLGKAPAE